MLVVIDTSAWARLREPNVAELIADAIGANAVVMTPPLLLELLRTARDAAELVQLKAEYGALRRVELTPVIVERALDVQEALARRGYHRGPSPVDLLAAAAAEAVGAELWHRDRDFELIGELTGQAVRRV